MGNDSDGPQIILLVIFLKLALELTLIVMVQGGFYFWWILHVR